MKTMRAAFLPPIGPAARGGTFILLALLVAPVALSAGPAAADETGLVLSGAYMQTIIPSRPAAGYFKLENQGDQARALVGAASTGCGMLMLHKSETVNGVDKMTEVPSIPVPAHGSVSFAPGGFHLMCMMPGPSIKVGGSVPVTLTFDDGGTLTSDFPVRGPGGN
jgi:periplasmic copper chaperone A